MFLGSSEAFADDVERSGAVPSAAFVVPDDIRHVGSLPPAPDSAGIGRELGCDAERVRGAFRAAAACAGGASESVDVVIVDDAGATRPRPARGETSEIMY